MHATYRTLPNFRRGIFLIDVIMLRQIKFIYKLSHNAFLLNETLTTLFGKKQDRTTQIHILHAQNFNWLFGDPFIFDG